MTERGMLLRSMSLYRKFSIQPFDNDRKHLKILEDKFLLGLKHSTILDY